MAEQTDAEPTPEPDSAVNEFINIMGPGPVIIEETPTDRERTEELLGVDPLPEITPIIDYMFTERSREGRHTRKLTMYTVGVLIGIVLLLGVLVMLCIPLLVFVTRKKTKKVPYDRASLAEKDPALLLKQTGFENPIYKFYSETGSKEAN